MGLVWESWHEYAGKGNKGIRELNHASKNQKKFANQIKRCIFAVIVFLFSLANFLLCHNNIVFSSGIRKGALAPPF